MKKHLFIVSCAISTIVLLNACDTTTHSFMPNDSSTHKHYVPSTTYNTNDEPSLPYHRQTVDESVQSSNMGNQPSTSSTTTTKTTETVVRTPSPVHVQSQPAAPVTAPVLGH